jgi:aminoglycoside phosphotransferase (APT) family kinase protein
LEQQTELDPNAILAALGVAGATEIRPVSGGADTAIWRVVHREHVYALRLFRAEQAATCRREVAAMRAAQAAGLPIPAIHAIGSWQDRPALLLGWCAGQPLLHVLSRQPWRTWQLGAAFGRMQAALHTVVPTPSPDLPAGGWIEWAGAQEAALQTQLRACAATTATLLHLDYHPLNVMTDSRRISTVLDWANAQVGDRRADVARTFTILALDPSLPRRPHVDIFRWVLVQAWRQGYHQAAGPLADMTLFYAWAGAVMLRDLAPRIGRTVSGFRPEQFDRIRRWTKAWKRRAGLGM